MSYRAFVLAVCIMTVLAHISLLWSRGWLIGQLWREFAKMKAEWESFRTDQEKLRKDFEASHKSPWLTGEPRKRTA